MSLTRPFHLILAASVLLGLSTAYAQQAQSQMNGIIIIVPAPTPSGEASQLPAASPTPGGLVQTTGGIATVRLDFTNFKVAAADNQGRVNDQYPAATLLWSLGPNGEVDDEAPVLELQIRGSTNEHCLTMPCGDTSLGLTATYSANPAYDANEPDQDKRTCTDSIKFGKRLPIGPDNTVDVLLEWGPDTRKLSVSVLKDIWKAEKGTQHIGFGAAVAGVPNPPKGIGHDWGFESISFQKHGGTVSLVQWQKVDPAPTRTKCELTATPH